MSCVWTPTSRPPPSAGRASAGRGAGRPDCPGSAAARPERWRGGLIGEQNTKPTNGMGGLTAGRAVPPRCPTRRKKDNGINDSDAGRTSRPASASWLKRAFTKQVTPSRRCMLGGKLRSSVVSGGLRHGTIDGLTTIEMHQGREPELAYARVSAQACWRHGRSTRCTPCSTRQAVGRLGAAGSRWRGPGYSHHTVVGAMPDVDLRGCRAASPAGRHTTTT